MTAVATVLIADAGAGADPDRSGARRWRCAAGGRRSGTAARAAGHAGDRAMVRRSGLAQRGQGGGRRRDAAGDRVCGAVRRGARRRRRGAARRGAACRAGHRRRDAAAGRRASSSSRRSACSRWRCRSRRSSGSPAAGAVVAYIVLVVLLTVARRRGAAVSGRDRRGSDVAARVRVVLRAGAGGRVRVALVARGAAGDGRERRAREAAAGRRRGSSCRWPHRCSASARAVAMPVGVLFLARLYGATLSPAQLASVVFTVILSSFAVPGVPGGSIIAMVPVLAAVEPADRRHRHPARRRHDSRHVPHDRQRHRQPDPRGGPAKADLKNRRDRKDRRETVLLSGSLRSRRLRGFAIATKTFVLTPTKTVVDNRAHEGAAPQTD